MDADYIVVGAGSAGCLVASRLSEDGSRVILLEAGPPDHDIKIKIPGLVLKLMHDPTLNWNYESQPEPGVAGRAIRWPRGKVLGGSGSINGMNFVRGNPADFDGWAQMGARGWSYDDVLPHFRAYEDRPEGDERFRGRGGPIRVENYRTILPITRAFVAAAEQAGHPFTPDINGERQEGVGYSQMNRTRTRQSTARTFLAEARKRPNLRVETDAMATRLLFEGGRCAGIRFRQHGEESELRAGREVILTAGAVNSPHLLQVSGIGAAEHLRSIGVEVVHALPGVGMNLSDHYQSRVAHYVKDATTVNDLARFPRVMWEAVRYAALGRGVFTFGGTQVSVFCRSREGLASPDLQLLFVPVLQAAPGKLSERPGMSLSVCPGRPDSRGTILARSPDPLEPPAIRPNYLSAESDRRAILDGFRIARRIYAQPAIARFSAGEFAPGPEVTSDAALVDYMRATGGSVYHPCGTCRMGEDPMAVVDSRLRLRGMAGLRVIDASVMPTATTGNIQAPVIMIAEKGASMIREDWASGTLARAA